MCVVQEGHPGELLSRLKKGCTLVCIMIECASAPAVTTAARPACRCSQGVCKLEGGFVVFCERALPGERVRARATNVRSRHALAVKLATLRPSPDEVSHLRAGWPFC